VSVFLDCPEAYLQFNVACGPHGGGRGATLRCRRKASDEPRPPSRCGPVLEQAAASARRTTSVGRCGPLTTSGVWGERFTDANPMKDVAVGGLREYPTFSLSDMANSPESARPTVADIIGPMEQSPLVSYLVDPNWCVAHCNPAWNRFAWDNGAPELAGERALGMDLRRVMGEDLRPFYRQAFEQAAKSGTVWKFLYECSSPKLFRKFQMEIHSLRPAGWYLITNTPVLERPHYAPVTTDLENYVNCDAQITLCSHCRSSRRALGREQWDFVPAHLERDLANARQSLCPTCRDYFYPNLDPGQLTRFGAS
jgi:hypothetical protein